MEKEKLISGINIFILVLSVYVLIILLADAFLELHPEMSRTISIIDNGVCALFFVEFLYRLFTAKSKLNYLRWGWLDLISAIPSVGIFRAARIIRIVRIVRAVKATRFLLQFLLFNNRSKITTSVSALAAVIILSASILILQFEADVQGATIHNAEDAIWWTIVTMATVGYGDFYPVTLGGRLIAVAVMIAGVGLFGTFTASMARWIIQGQEKHEH